MRETTPGQPDGAFGPRTRGAIQAWQQANGYAATGVLTGGQVEQLLASEGAAGSAAPGGLHGSIAFSQLGDGGYAYAIAWNAQGREAARRSALEECRRQGGGSGCHEAGWFANQCGALAIGDGDGYGTGAGKTNARAEDSALLNCRAANRNCRVEASRCVDGDYKVAAPAVAPKPSAPDPAAPGEHAEEVADTDIGHDPPDLSGTYSIVAGVTPLGFTYTGTVTISKQSELRPTYCLKWVIPDPPQEEFGCGELAAVDGRDEFVLSVDWDAGEPAIYHVSKDGKFLKGRWHNGAGIEDLRRQ